MKEVVNFTQEKFSSWLGKRNILHDPLLGHFLKVDFICSFLDANWKKIIVENCSESETFGCKFLLGYTSTWLYNSLKSLPCHSPVLCTEHGPDVAGLPCPQHLEHQDHSVIHGQFFTLNHPHAESKSLTGVVHGFLVTSLATLFWITCNILTRYPSQPPQTDIR